jgi:site-specific DNA recombinase
VTLKAAIYVRQSVDKAEGITRQRTRCEALCAAKGFTVVEVYEDNDTSASKRRGANTSWGRMLSDIEAGRVDTVVAVDMDRLLRSMSDLLELTKLEAKVLTVSGEIDLTTPDGGFRAQMLAAIAEYETKQKGARHSRANLARVAAGKPVPGRRRYGYASDNMTPLEPEAQDVRDIFAAFLSEDADAGEHKDRKSGSIRGLALERGWRNVRVREVLSNPSYKGWVVHKGQASPGLITPLVSVEDWDAAQVKLADPTRKTTTGQTPKHMLSGLAECGVCGETMFYMRSYRCRADSAHPSINKDILDPLIMWEVFAWAVESEEVEESREVKELVTEAVELTRQRDAQQELYVMPGADKKKVARELTRLGAELEKLERDIERARSAEATSDVLSKVRGEWWAHRDVQEFTEREQKAVDEWPAYWEGLGLETQRSLIRGLFRVVVNPGRHIERVEVSARA